MGENIRVEIFAYTPTDFYHCTHCEVAWREFGMSNDIHREQLQSSLPPDLAREYQQISDWVRQINNKYGDKVCIQVVDAASIEGVLKSLRYGLHRYPAVVVAGKPSSKHGDVFDSASKDIARLIER